MKKMLYSLIVLGFIIVGLSFGEKAEASDVEYLILSDLVYEATSSNTIKQQFNAVVKEYGNNKKIFTANQRKTVENGYFLVNRKINAKNGFIGVTYYNEKRNELVMSFAGTKLISVDTLKNLEKHFKATYKHGQTNDAVKLNTDTLTALDAGKLTYTNAKNKKVKIPKTAKIVYTGHSLGGYHALYVTLETNKGKFAKYFKKTVTYNAIGLHTKIMPNDHKKIYKTKNVTSNTRNYYSYDFVNDINNFNKFTVLGSQKHTDTKMYINTIRAHYLYQNYSNFK